mmetsp:Transcript_30429/g.52099  ORF Transcript_30429/g.52099 Transcript_30429/m.52099 type:complete len:206 (+) Transcript_30429:1949-2566(+)
MICVRRLSRVFLPGPPLLLLELSLFEEAANSSFDCLITELSKLSTMPRSILYLRLYAVGKKYICSSGLNTALGQLRFGMSLTRKAKASASLDLIIPESLKQWKSCPKANLPKASRVKHCAMCTTSNSITPLDSALHTFVKAVTMAFATSIMIGLCSVIASAVRAYCTSPRCLFQSDPPDCKMRLCCPNVCLECLCIIFTAPLLEV